MIAKKLRKTITVDGVEYEYCVTGCVNVFIRQLTSPHKTFKWWEEWKPKWKQAITPKNIESIIKTGSPYHE